MSGFTSAKLDMSATTVHYAWRQHLTGITTNIGWAALVHKNILEIKGGLPCLRDSIAFDQTEFDTLHAKQKENWVGCFTDPSTLINMCCDPLHSEKNPSVSYCACRVPRPDQAVVWHTACATVGAEAQTRPYSHSTNHILAKRNSYNINGVTILQSLPPWSRCCLAHCMRYGRSLNTSQIILSQPVFASHVTALTARQLRLFWRTPRRANTFCSTQTRTWLTCTSKCCQSGCQNEFAWLVWHSRRRHAVLRRGHDSYAQVVAAKWLSKWICLTCMAQ